MMLGGLLEQVIPPTFVRGAAGPLDDFMREWGVAPLLFVALDEEPNGELENSLLALSDSVPDEFEPTAPMAFCTDWSGGGSAGHRQDSSFQAIAARLREHRHFVLPLVKRAEKSFSQERILVGRTRNVDVVLRDRSVSKLHGWFERHDDMLLYADAGSHNGSLVRGERLTPRKLVVLRHGDTVVFGGVSALLCDPSNLWTAIHDLES